MPIKTGLMASIWAPPQNSIPKSPPPASSPALNLKGEVITSLPAAHFRDYSTDSTDSQPSLLHYPQRPVASICTPRPKQQACSQREHQQRSHPTFTITIPQAAPDHSLHTEEMHSNGAVSDMMHDLDLSSSLMDEDMPDAPADLGLASEPPNTSVPLSFDASAEQQCHDLQELHGSQDESEKIFPQQFIGKRRIRSDNSAELPTKVPKFESRTCLAGTEGSHRSNGVNRKQRMRMQQVKQLQTRVIAQSELASEGLAPKPMGSHDPSLMHESTNPCWSHAPTTAMDGLSHKALPTLDEDGAKVPSNDMTDSLTSVEQVQASMDKLQIGMPWKTRERLLARIANVRANMAKKTPTPASKPILILDVDLSDKNRSTVDSGGNQIENFDRDGADSYSLRIVRRENRTVDVVQTRLEGGVVNDRASGGNHDNGDCADETRQWTQVLTNKFSFWLTLHGDSRAGDGVRVLEVC
nr:hypothetical protein CFP56_24263 [Quercus suber]